MSKIQRDLLQIYNLHNFTYYYAHYSSEEKYKNTNIEHLLPLIQ